MILIKLLLRLDNHEDWYIDINLGIVYLNLKSASKEVILDDTNLETANGTDYARKSRESPGIVSGV